MSTVWVPTTQGTGFRLRVDGETLCVVSPSCNTLGKPGDLSFTLWQQEVALKGEATWENIAPILAKLFPNHEIPAPPEMAPSRWTTMRERRGN